MFHLFKASTHQFLEGITKTLNYFYMNYTFVNSLIGLIVMNQLL